MANNHDIAFTHSHLLTEDGAVAFKCDGDVDKWPWLALPPAHPIVVQTINYWASVETGKTRGTLDPNKWSALTYSRWQARVAGSGPVSHGIADTPPESIDSDKPGFRLTFFDAGGNLVCRIVGTGVVFHTRDFEAWRDQAKTAEGTLPSADTFSYASASALGVSSDVQRFLSPLIPSDVPSATALVTKKNGLMPHHPYHSGSGDHVNANHLADAGFQFAHLLTSKPLRCTRGEITFRHFVELGRPFTLKQTNTKPDSISLSVHQSDRLCTQITLGIEDIASSEIDQS